jgi:hypothetical protein
MNKTICKICGIEFNSKWRNKICSHPCQKKYDAMTSGERWLLNEQNRDFVDHPWKLGKVHKTGDDEI